MILFDTNIILEDATLLNTYEPDRILILPEIVLDECDSKKSGYSELAFNAREVGRILAKGTILSTTKEGLHTITAIDIGRELHIISKSEYSATGDASILNDRKIIEIAYDFSAEFVSNDVMARIRAIADGVTAKAYDLVDDSEVNTFKTLDIPSFDNIEAIPIMEVDPEYTAEAKSYLLCTKDGNQKLGIVINDKIQLVDEKELVRQEASPLNKEQKVFSSAILSDMYDILLSDSKAGSGKGVVTLSSMMKLVKQKKYNKIYYVRNTVNNFDSAEEVGYLATNEAKFAQFYTPLYDTLRFFAEQTFKGQKIAPSELEERLEERVNHLMSKFNIEPITTLGLRGRTLRGLIWVDEVQNFSPGSLKTLLTRIGEDSKVVLTGCQSQIDNDYLTKMNNGFAVLQNSLREKTSIRTYTVSLRKVVRGKITEFADEVFG